MIVHPREQDQAIKIRTAQILAAFSLATDLAISRPMQHVVRACYIGMHIARRLALSNQDQSDLPGINSRH